MTNTKTKFFKDLGFKVIATLPKEGEVHVNYKIYEINPSELTDGNEVFASGAIKWDGCSNWKFDEQERCMLHGCTKQHLLNLGIILAECWEWTRELLPAFAEYNS